MIRLAVVAILVVAAFTALFSRLWFLQVLAADDFKLLAKENRVRLVQSEPPRGRILDRNGYVLVDTRQSTSITIDREVVIGHPLRKRRVLGRLSDLLKVPTKELNTRLKDVTVSPYKPVAVAHDVPMRAVEHIAVNPEDFVGVDVETRPVRFYPQGPWAAQILGYVGEVTESQLKEPYFKKARPRYQAGDVVGRSGLERSYDRYLRGTPRLERVIVNSSGKRVGEPEVITQQEPGMDLVTHLDVRIQRIAERALASGINANRGAGYRATDGGAVVLDPNTGGVVAMASFPTFDPGILSDGLQTKEYNEILGHKTEDNFDDALMNRTTQVAYSPGSTFKVPVAMAAMGLDIANASTYLDCPGSKTFGDGTGAVTFPNWTSTDYGAIGFARSLEISCDTFYYQLGWDMESAWGAANGDGSERFQDFLRSIGFGRTTGLDLPGEIGGVVPDERWLDNLCEAYEEEGVVTEGCSLGWLPGYTVNMSIGQGDVITTPLQMALSYAGIANGGVVPVPRVADYLGDPEVQQDVSTELPSPEPLVEASPSVEVSPSVSASPSPTPSPSPSGEKGEDARASLEDERVVERIKPEVLRRLPLDPTEIGVLHQGLEDVIMGDEGTAAGAFAGFPLDRYPIAGKTGTAQIGESDYNRAWFLSYAPSDDPQYVVGVYLNYAGHGGESAAPVAREIFEGIFELDGSTEDVTLGSDASG